MSLEAVRAMVSGLPRSLADQVIGYAESVQRALPEIFKDAHVAQSTRLGNEMVFIAGVRKLHWVAASSFWTLENSGKLLSGMNISRIRIGGKDVYKGGEIFSMLHALLHELEVTLSRRKLLEYVRLSWTDVLTKLADNEHH